MMRKFLIACINIISLGIVMDLPAQSLGGQVVYDSLTNRYRVVELGTARSREDLPEDEFVALHPSLEVGTYIRVENPKNNTFVMVKTVGKSRLEGSVIDLSKKAFAQLGLERADVFRVSISYTPNWSNELAEAYLELQKKQIKINQAEEQNIALLQARKRVANELEKSKRQLAFYRLLSIFLSIGCLVGLVIIIWLYRQRLAQKANQDHQ